MSLRGVLRKVQGWFSLVSQEPVFGCQDSESHICFPKDYVPALVLGALQRGGHGVIGLSLATENGVDRYRLSMNEALTLFDRLGRLFGAHHGPSAIRRDEVRRFFSPGDLRPPEESWVVDLRDGHYLVSRYLHGKIEEAYRPFAQDEICVVLAAISSGHEPPAALRRRDTPPHQIRPEQNLHPEVSGDRS